MHLTMNRTADHIVASNAPRDCGTSLAPPRGTRRPGHVVIELEFAMTYRLEVDGPITASDGTDASISLWRVVDCLRRSRWNTRYIA